MLADRGYGPKFNKDLSTKDIAKKVREDIKKAILHGDLPQGLKVSVRYESFSGGSSVDAKITAFPEGLIWLNPEWVRANYLEPNVYHERIPRLSKDGSAIEKTIDKIRESYNYDGSNSMIDHFDVNYYGSTSIDHELEENERKRIVALIKSEQKEEFPQYGIGDEVKSSIPELKGIRLFVTEISHNGPVRKFNGLSLHLRAAGSNDDIYIDSDDLDTLSIVKKVPPGMKILKFKSR